MRLADGSSGNGLVHHHDDEAIAVQIGELAGDFARDNVRLHFREYAQGRCFTESYKFLMVARERGLHARIIEASSPIGNHFAVSFDGLIVDHTASQFDRFLAFPWIGTRREWERSCLQWIGAIHFRLIRRTAEGGE